MKNARRIPLIVGLLLALGTGVLMLNYLGSARTPAVAPARTVYVAAHDVPARALLNDALVTEVKRPASEIDPDAVVDRKELAGKYSLITIPAGSVVTRSKIGLAGANALPARLPIGMRAVSISIDKVKGVAGLIQPGDRVDVIAVPPRVANEVPRASAILRGALVLAMGNEVETTSATPSPDNQNLTTVTLALTPRQVDLLASADLNTTLRLALRPPKESIRAFPAEPLKLGVPERASVQIMPAPAAPAQAPAAPPPVTPAVVAAAKPRAAAPNAVQVIELDRIEGNGPRR
ncbi:MAG TPA: Flp pilus assembly protein CpaB [Candidatus Elarobacter sp.]|nr:Flp pilus assembly protein CpaB [Candidatus Elarobacter sp.]HEV2741133.1 Flp pilus assembly protein CpaB [Candidatus Elarobacter sp.]